MSLLRVGHSMIRKTLERSERGIVLIRVETFAAGDKPAAFGYRLSTPSSAWVIADRDKAHAAFSAEVGALAARSRSARLSARR